MDGEVSGFTDVGSDTDTVGVDDGVTEAVGVLSGVTDAEGVLEGVADSVGVTDGDMLGDGATTSDTSQTTGLLSSPSFIAPPIATIPELRMSIVWTRSDVSAVLTDAGLKSTKEPSVELSLQTNRSDCPLFDTVFTVYEVLVCASVTENEIEYSPATTTSPEIGSIVIEVPLCSVPLSDDSWRTQLGEAVISVRLS